MRNARRLMQLANTRLFLEFCTKGMRRVLVRVPLAYEPCGDGFVFTPQGDQAVVARGRVSRARIVDDCGNLLYGPFSVGERSSDFIVSNECVMC